MTTNKRRYWGYRIDTRHAEFFRQELDEGRLRQGWGWEEGQDLRLGRENLGPSVVPNLRMLEVKKGDILLVPRLPEWHLVAIVEATEDWDKGYRFEIPTDKGDYGHSFPARLVKRFSREAEAVKGGVRASLRFQQRFWNMDRHSAEIDLLRATQQEELDKSITDESRLDGAIKSAFYGAFDKGKFGKSVYETLNKEFDNTRWEHVLVQVLRTRYPACKVDGVGGGKEKFHGTDILIQLPGMGMGEQKTFHVIAVQVKDWDGKAGNDPIDQIQNAVWWEQEGHQVIEKVVIFTKVRRKDQDGHLLENASRLLEYADRPKVDVRIVFAEELQELLTDYGKRTMGLED